MLDEQGDPTVNYIKISSRGMEVRKKGQVNTHMVFEQGKRNMAFYTTPVSYTHLDVYKRQELCLECRCCW